MGAVALTALKVWGLPITTPPPPIDRPHPPPKSNPHAPPIRAQSYQYFKAGAQYIVRDGQVVIVDESTGRVKPISRYQARVRVWGVGFGA